MSRGNLAFYSFSQPVFRFSGVLLVGLFVTIVPGIMLQFINEASFATETTLTLSLFMAPITFLIQILSLLGGIFIGVSITGFYYDMRVRKEGFSYIENSNNQT